MATHEPLMNAFVKAKKQGKTRFIGISTHQNEQYVIRSAVDAGVYDVVLTAYNFAQDHREQVKKSIEYAAKKGVGIVAMKTQEKVNRICCKKGSRNRCHENSGREELAGKREN
jgi:predicted aldo/keto reductase-like oxidoreductase